MKTISTKNAPAAIGPYSQAKVANGFVFASGQIPLNPETGEVALKRVVQTFVKETDTKELVENSKKKSKTADLVKEADEFAEKNNPIEKVLDKEEEPEIAR